MADVDLAALAREVRYLRDRADILDCMSRYTRGADRMDRELLLGAYWEDATDDRGAFTGGREARVDWLLKFLETVGHTSHHISNFTIDIDGDIAHAESYVLTTLMPKDGSTVSLGGARYIDRFERRGGEWRIAHRESVMDFSCTVPAGTLPPGALSGVRGPEDRSYARPLTLSEAGLARLRATEKKIGPTRSSRAGPHRTSDRASELPSERDAPIARGRRLLPDDSGS